MLLDRLFSLLSPDEVNTVLRGFGWTMQDYQRGYILKVHGTRKNIIPFSRRGPGGGGLAGRPSLRFSHYFPLNQKYFYDFESQLREAAKISFLMAVPFPTAI